MATEIVIHIFKMLITVRADTLLHCGKDFLTVMPQLIILQPNSDYRTIPTCDFIAWKVANGNNDVYVLSQLLYNYNPYPHLVIFSPCDSG